MWSPGLEMGGAAGGLLAVTRSRAAMPRVDEIQTGGREISDVAGVEGAAIDLSNGGNHGIGHRHRAAGAPRRGENPS